MILFGQGGTRQLASVTRCAAVVTGQPSTMCPDLASLPTLAGTCNWVTNHAVPEAADHVMPVHSRDQQIEIVLNQIN